jgi:hypothetical protein
MIYSKEKITAFTETAAHKIFDHPIISFALGAGGFIAGGFGRQVLKNPDELYGYLVECAGDIDIFFPSSKIYESTLEFAGAYCNERKQKNPDCFSHNFSIRPSLANFCTNIFLPESEFFSQNTHVNGRWYQPGNIKIQLVNVFHGDPSRVLSTFDIENCKVALTSDSVIFSKSFESLESSKTLEVVHNGSPLLPMRIQKYVYKRGLDNVHMKSGSQMRDWIVNWACNNWGDYPLAEAFKQCTPDAVYKETIARLLKYENLIETDQLSLLFGRLTYSVRVGGNYNAYWKTIDPVKNELKRRKLLT